MKVTIFRDIKEENWPSMELYADQLIRHLQREFSDEVAIKPVSVGPFFSMMKGRFLTASVYATRATKYPVVASLNQGDVNHIIDHTYAQLANFVDRRRTVVTCHDLAPLVLRDTLPKPSVGLAFWDWAFRGMLKAAKIIADSENTRKDILRFTDYPLDRVEVIYPGIGDAFQPIADRDTLEMARERLGLPRAAIILHVGHCRQRKNIEGMLMALKELACGKVDRVRFVQVGGAFSRDQWRLIDKLHLRDCVTQINWVHSSDLPLVYNLADVFVFPSHYEGFGFPPLEAMACGTPVVSSNASSLPEIVGDAAITVSPSDHQGLAAAIEKLLGDAELRDSLVAKGLARAKLFSWADCARKTFAVYQEVHSKSNHI